MNKRVCMFVLLRNYLEKNYYEKVSVLDKFLVFDSLGI